jgi:hypothetical protein
LEPRALCGRHCLCSPKARTGWVSIHGCHINGVTPSRVCRLQARLAIFIRPARIRVDTDSACSLHEDVRSRFAGGHVSSNHDIILGCVEYIVEPCCSQMGLDVVAQPTSSDADWDAPRDLPFTRAHKSRVIQRAGEFHRDGASAVARTASRAMAMTQSIGLGAPSSPSTPWCATFFAARKSATNCSDATEPFCDRCRWRTMSGKGMPAKL